MNGLLAVEIFGRLRLLRFQSVYQIFPVVNASVINVFCSNSCAFADPVAGLALGERFTLRTGRPSPASLRSFGTIFESDPIFHGPSCTQTISPACRASSAANSSSGNG